MDMSLFGNSITGPDGGIYFRSAGSLQAPDGGTYFRQGDAISSPTGGSILVLGDVATLADGQVVCRSGNCWQGPKGAYVLSGGLLTGPDGKTWSGVRPEDVPILIDRDR